MWWPLLALLCAFFAMSPAGAAFHQSCSQKWSEFAPLPPLDSTRGPAGVADGTNLHVFASGITGASDRSVYINSFESIDGGSSGWGKIPGDFTTDQAVGAAMFGSGLYVLATSYADHRLYSNVRDSSGNWQGWRQIPGGARTLLAPAVAVMGRTLHLVHTGLDGKLYSAALPINTGIWSTWSQVSGPAVSSVAPSAAASPSRLFIFHTGTNSRIYMASRGPLSGWTGWTEVPGGGQTNLAPSATVGENTLYLFANGTDDRHPYLNRMLWNEDSWTGWESVTAAGTTDRAVAAIYHSTSAVSIIAHGIGDRKFYLAGFGTAGHDNCDLALAYAPIHFQDTDNSSPRGDYVARFDYDGDWKSLNNWDNMFNYPIKAASYYSVVEGCSHNFITYSYFHPRDWMDPYELSDEHENDLEGVLLAVAKDGTRQGRLA